MEALSLPYKPFPSLICAAYTTSVSPDSRRLLDHSGSGKVQPSPMQSEPFGFSTRGLLQPKFGQQNEDGTSVPADMPDVIMTLVSYFCGLPGLPRKARKHYNDIGKVPLSKLQFAETMWRYSLLMPPGKKTKKTLACVFAGANVLETCERDHHPVLIYRLGQCSQRRELHEEVSASPLTQTYRKMVRYLKERDAIIPK